VLALLPCDKFADLAVALRSQAERSAIFEDKFIAYNGGFAAFCVTAITSVDVLRCLFWWA